MPTKKPRFDAKVFLTQATSGGNIVKFHKKQFVFWQGDRADSLFHIQEGTLKLTVTSKQGKEAVLALLGPGDFFGEGCLAGQQHRMSGAFTLSECSLVRLKKEFMIRMLHDEPEFSALFLTHVLTRNIRIEEDLVDQLFNSTEKRLARLLLLLANFGKDSQPEPVIPQINQEMLAEMIGTTRTRVNFFMSRFRKMGYIEYKDGLKVHSLLMNVLLHD